MKSELLHCLVFILDIFSYFFKRRLIPQFILNEFYILTSAPSAGTNFHGFIYSSKGKLLANDSKNFKLESIRRQEIVHTFFATCNEICLAFLLKSGSLKLGINSFFSTFSYLPLKLANKYLPKTLPKINLQILLHSNINTVFAILNLGIVNIYYSVLVANCKKLISHKRY